MMRFLFLILLIFPLFILAEPGKVVGVIPVKFNSKGMHAPVPYNQQLMQRGWTRVPTLNLPFTYAGGAGQNPRYQPTKVTKKSLARALGYAAGRAANMTPAGKALLIAYGAYEANCITENYPSLCVSDEFDPNSDLSQIDDFQLAKQVTNAFCATASAPSGGAVKTYGCGYSQHEAYSKALTAYLSDKNAQPCGNVLSCSYSLKTQTPPVSAAFQLSWSEKCNIKPDGSYDVCHFKVDSGYVNFGYNTQNTWYVCPPEDLNNPIRHEMLSKYTVGPYKFDGTQRCYKPSLEFPVTPEWIQEQDAKDPTKLPNSDVGLDDFVDWETGLPRPDAFEEPTYDPVSPAFAEAAEAIANGTVQHNNPNAPGYVPREMMPNLLVQINNWHEGNTFIDVYSGKEVKPDTPPPEESKIDWSKFPGITKAQYEASNNAWGKSAADQAPNINDEISKGEEEFTKLKETINDVPAETPFVMDFADLVIFPSGGCKGFTVAASLAGQPKSIIVDKHCPPYDAWGRGFIEWILFVATAFQIFHIFRRTLEVV